ncbi:peptidoglycan-binding domain-containing protein [Actinomadura macrotermitis]|uniref:Peptidoglycan binding-like domain-containing protein n=1 Tax=Actinomadura macrotermitis TaxID=2585200 RepID=A0A7K0BTK9_9ACTN|nr:peptidoglycan-binding domain-containing protein [Actinomadura macrotermitis]MQY04528.1 hypothetical protein [Actinomadura macrotermitis]
MNKLFGRSPGSVARQSISEREVRPERRRQRFLLWIIAAAVMISAVGIGASAWVKSPQQLAAEAAPPQPSIITAAVERRVLTQSVILRGTVTAGKSIKVNAAPVTEGKSVVTRTPVHQGQQINAGKVVAEISGRPIIALHGKFPAYRDIRKGAQGPDVRQLQLALRRIGYPVGDRAGQYGASTQNAVGRLFKDRGYEPAVESTSGVSPKKGTDQTQDDPVDRGHMPEKRSNSIVRAGEVVFVPRFPARVTEVKAGMGAEVTGTVLSLSSGELVVHGIISADDRKLVSPQKRVSIFDEEYGADINGHVASVGSFSKGDAKAVTQEGGTDGVGSQPGYPIVVHSDHSLPERLAGMDVRLTIETASTEGPVLVVPSSAIFANADGSTRVIKVVEGGRQQQVNVQSGPSSGGFVAVESEELSESDRVMVGK